MARSLWVSPSTWTGRRSNGSSGGGFEVVFQIVVVILVQVADEDRLLGALQLSVDRSDNRPCCACLIFRGLIMCRAAGARHGKRVTLQALQVHLTYTKQP